MTGKATDPVARFWAKVDKSGSCWRWLGRPHKSGYGRHSPKPGVIVYAHRYSYELNVGTIPEGLQLDHLCRNTMCVRPDHLEPVTQRVNQLRGEGPAAINARKTHCPAGHPLDEHAYTWTGLSGATHRRCRACNTEAARQYRRRRAAKAVAA